MAFQRRIKKGLILLLAALALAPVFITAYEVIFTENKSVIFLGNYHPKVAILVICYYALLFCFGIFWLTREIIFITRLKNEKTKTELMLLKSQVSPHFFFNMLNNLYGMVAKDVQRSQELILKLSDMMRYSIYEVSREIVTLGEEVTFLKNYIELHTMRYHKKINIEFGCDVPEERKVAPLLFIILLENAFKHGVENLRENAYINIRFISAEDHLKFTIENNYVDPGHTPGIGLKNLKRRLELTYPDHHDLSFSISDTVYRVQLTLNNYDKIYNR